MRWWCCGVSSKASELGRIPSPRSYGERVGVRGKLQRSRLARNSRARPAPRFARSTSPRSRGEVNPRHVCANTSSSYDAARWETFHDDALLLTRRYRSRIRAHRNHPRRARRRHRSATDRARQEGRSGHLLHRPDRRAGGAAAGGGVRRQVRHQGALRARRQPGQRGQDPERVSRRPRAIRRVRPDLRPARADRRRRRACVHHRQRRRAAAAIPRSRPLLGVVASVRDDARDQHRPGAGGAAAEEL